jgi:hypothetical protein
MQIVGFRFLETTQAERIIVHRVFVSNKKSNRNECGKGGGVDGGRWKKGNWRRICTVQL